MMPLLSRFSRAGETSWSYSDLLVAGLTVSKSGHKLLDSAAISLPAGTVTAVLGATGSGKSTLVRTVLGLEYPDTGSIFARRPGAETPVDLTRWSPRKRAQCMGAVLQRPGVFHGRSPRENIQTVLRARGAAENVADRRTDELLHFLALESRADEAINDKFSGGEQARIALGRALAAAPQFLLIDEAFSAIDGPLRRLLLSEIARQARGGGRVVLFITHDQTDAFMFADRTAIMEDGRAAVVGPTEDVYLRPTTESVAQFLGLGRTVEGTATGRSSTSETIVALPSLAVEVAAHLNGKDSVTDGTKLKVLLRPEDLTVEPAALRKDKDEFKALVEERIFAGSVRLLRLRTDAFSLLASAPQGVMLERGETVVVRVRKGVAAIC